MLLRQETTRAASSSAEATPVPRISVCGHFRIRSSVLSDKTDASPTVEVILLFAEAGERLADHGVVQAASQLAQLRQSKPPGSPPQSQGRVPAPITVPVGTFRPTLPFGPLQCRDNLPPARPPRRAPERLLLPAVAPGFPLQLLGQSAPASDARGAGAAG